MRRGLRYGSSEGNLSDLGGKDRVDCSEIAIPKINHTSDFTHLCNSFESHEVRTFSKQFIPTGSTLLKFHHTLLRIRHRRRNLIIEHHTLNRTSTPWNSPIHEIHTRQQNLHLHHGQTRRVNSQRKSGDRGDSGSTFGQCSFWRPRRRPKIVVAFVVPFPCRY
jgi:hypothetical protein